MTSRSSTATACRHPRLPRSRPRDARTLAVVAQYPEQARRVQAPAALRLHARVELVDERGHRQRGALRARFGEAQAEVLPHPVDSEAEVEFVGDHRLAAIFHLPRLGGALADDIEAALDVEAGFLREV